MAYDILIQGAHVARCILNTLSDRPISVSNTPYVISSLRGLHSISVRMRAIASSLRAEDVGDCMLFAHMLDGVIELPRTARLNAIRRYILDDLPLYRRIQEAPFEFKDAPERLLAGRKYSRLLVMVGPGIGIGDEVNFIRFFETLRDTLEVPAAGLEVFTFARPLWQAMGPEIQSTDLSANPLQFFDRVRQCLSEESPGEVLIVFASFMGQEMLRCFLPYSDCLDCMEVSLSSGQGWMQLRGEPARWTHRAISPTTRNMSRALDELLLFLLGKHDSVHLKRSTLSYQTGVRSEFRLFVNPFTSKFSPLTPEHWAQFIEEVRRALPQQTQLSCRICPGLSASCHDYAQGIIDAVERMDLRDVHLDVLGRDTGIEFGPENGIPEVYKALSRADLVLAIDTYTAHIAAHLRILSIAFCLNRNPEFWQPAVNTFWLDINKGYRDVAAMIRVVTMLATKDQARSRVMDRYIAESSRLSSLGHPLNLLSSMPDNGGKGSDTVAVWVDAARAVWNALPKQMLTVLDAMDSDHTWPLVSDELTRADNQTRKTSLEKIAESSFFRLACLAAASERTRGTAQYYMESEAWPAARR